MGGMCSKEDDEYAISGQNQEQIEQEAERQEQEYFDELEPRKSWIIALNEQSQKVIIPLQNLAYKVEILHSVAKVNLELSYQNPSQQPIFVSFYFQISPEACFDGLEAQMGQNLIKTVIKHRDQGALQIQGNIQQGQGQVPGFSEINDDIIEVQLGQVGPQEKIIIRFQYLEELFLEMNKFELILPYNIFPDFSNNRQSQQVRQQYGYQQNLAQNQFNQGSSFSQQLNPLDPMQYTWSIQVTVHSPNNKITLIDSQTHRLGIKKISEYQSIATVDNPQQRKEFVMHVNFANPHSYLLEKNENDLDLATYCCLINYVPEINKIKKLQDKFSLRNCQGEFIFLLDRSGSMQGEKIDLAKEALCLFLKSLPVNSYFNVISFGSSYYSMEDISIRSNDHNVEVAIQHIESMQADMGGTELLEPLEHIFHYQKNIEGYPRFIFLLTDGEVQNTNQVIDIIRKHNIHSEVFTLGVGHEVCQNLIKGAASAGNGTFEFAHSHKHIKQHIIKLLKSAMSRELPTFQIGFDSKNLDMMMPIPEREKLIKGGQAFNCFIFFNKDLQIDNKLEIKLYFKVKNTVVEDKIILNVNQGCIPGTLIHKMGAHKAIMKFQDNIQRHGDIKDDILIPKTFGQIEVRGLQYALQYQILCQQTGFVIVNQEDNNFENNQFQFQNQKFIVSTRYATRIGYTHNQNSMFLHSKWKQDNPNLAPRIYQYNDFAYMNQQQQNYPQQQQNLYNQQGQVYNNGMQNQGYIELVKVQRQQGYWEVTAFNIQQIGLQNIDQVINSKPQLIENLHAWFTILVVVYLQTQHKNDHHTWDLVVIKAQELLYSENININQYYDLAKKTLRV